MSIARNAVVCACFLMLMGCTFQSRQLNFVRELFAEKTDPFEDQKWIADWGDNQYTLYAVYASEEQSFFANSDDLLISFEGWNLTETSGILPNGDVGKIEPQGEELLYFVNDRLIARHQCAPWVRAEFENGDYQLNQNCYGREAYVNEILVTSDGSGTRLRFLIHPEYPQLTLMPLNSGN